MKRDEIIAAIQQLKDIAGNLQCQIAALEELVSNENHQEETPDETLVVNKLPDPPKVIYLEPDEETVIGCKILTELPDFYTGKCSVLKVHKRWFNNGQPRLFIDKYHVVIEAYDANMELLGSTVTHWNNLGKFHVELIKRGINTHSKDNWKPKTLLFDLD
jgi:hypothetical protein